jgi:hypothetical protein
MPYQRRDIVDEKDTKVIKEVILDSISASLEAQLRAVRRLRNEGEPVTGKRRTGKSQIDIVGDILRRAGKALHINEIVSRAEKYEGVKLDRESVVSALTKKVQRADRFVRTGPNTFALKGGGH